METARIWHELHGDLRQFIRRRADDENLADDLLQETFLRIHDRIDTLADSERVVGWVYRIARNVINDHYRAAGRRSVGELNSEPAFEDSPKNWNEHIANWLRGMIDELPDRYREAMRLSEQSGVTQRDVADRLNLSLSGAKSRIQRGRQMLKEALLECCHVEWDQNGNVVEYVRRSQCATCCQSASDANCSES